MYPEVKTRPASIPQIAPSLFSLLENIPKSRTGKRVAAAKPKAKATTCATKAGGYIPTKPATLIASAVANLLQSSSSLSSS